MQIIKDETLISSLNIFYNRSLNIYNLFIKFSSLLNCLFKMNPIHIILYKTCSTISQNTNLPQAWRIRTRTSWNNRNKKLEMPRKKEKVGEEAQLPCNSTRDHAARKTPEANRMRKQPEFRSFPVRTDGAKIQDGGFAFTEKTPRKLVEEKCEETNSMSLLSKSLFATVSYTN